MRALLIVDMQYDFMPDGPLPVPGAYDIIDGILALSRTYPYVVGSLDWHPANHCSFDPAPRFEDGSWPAHCVAGTHGALPLGGLAGAVATFVHKGVESGREAYSAFDGTRLATLLRNQRVTDLDVCGVALEKCVLKSALDAHDEGFRPRVLLDHTRALSDWGRADATGTLRRAGVEVV